MPTYVYQRADNDEVLEVVMTSEELAERQFNGSHGQYIELDGGTLAKRIYTPIGGHLPANWPIVSSAAGVGQSQIREAMAIDRKAGVPTEYTPDGDVIFNSAPHRNKWLRAHNMFDRKAWL